jgi:hypothetical protein
MTNLQNQILMQLNHLWCSAGKSGIYSDQTKKEKMMEQKMAGELY